MADNANWYVVHTYSGYENTVKATIEKYVENRHLQDMIHEISIPLETVTEITDNGPKEVERKVFPGYVLVKMVMNDETWHVVRNIRGVTGFLGEGNKPIPLSEDDVASLGVEKREVVVGYQVGDSVRSPTALWSPYWAPWRSWIWSAAKSGWWCPCSDARLPWSWSWTRSSPWSSDPGNKPLQPRGLRPQNVGGTAPSVPPNWA